MAGAPLPQGLYFLPICVGGVLIALFALRTAVGGALRPYRVGSTDFGYGAAVFRVFCSVAHRGAGRVCAVGRLACHGPVLGLPSIVVVQQLAAGASLTTLIAIPLFIFAGEMMMRGGYRPVDCAGVIPGRASSRRSGQINVLSSLFFGGVSGSAIADVSAIGGAMIPQMVNRGFDP